MFWKNSAYKDFCSKYYLCYIYAQCLLQNQHDAEEVALHTLLEISFNEGLRNEEAITAAIRRIVTNKCFEKKPHLKAYYEDDLANNTQSTGKLAGKYENALRMEKKLTAWKLLSRAEQKEKIREYASQFNNTVSQYSDPYITDTCFEEDLMTTENEGGHFIKEEVIIKRLQDLVKIKPGCHWKRFKEQCDSANPKKVNYLSMAAAAAAIAAVVIPVVYHISIQRQFTHTESAIPVKQYAATEQEPELIFQDGSVIKPDRLPDDAFIAAGMPFKKHGSTLAYVPFVLSDEVADPGIIILSIPPCRQYQITLADGSVVDLNASSQLHFPLKFSKNERRVEMNGEAFFKVKANLENPFFVKLKDQVTIKVTGTSFNIDAYRETDYIRTSLIEGRLQIISNGSRESKLLLPGQQASYSKGRFSVNNRLNEDQITAWKEAWFYFDDKSIPEIIEEIEHWYNVKIIYNGILPTGHFTGKFRRSTPLQDLIKKILKDREIKIGKTSDTLIVSK
ncbi:FecR family protein [Niastella sp. OAS944]|uniref:FecR family protein n=1 Tax=Niastella sp. OAS944 TaxID=2664089 RepID=UPI003473352F|nr:hypothetical protein [Chitinophagaceae bacterium OAS944]